MLNVDPANAGRIDRNPSKNCYDPSEAITLTAVANSGFVFDSWGGADAGDISWMQGPEHAQVQTNMWWHRGITAIFVADTGSGNVSVVADISKAASARARTRAAILSAPGGFTAALPANHRFTSYRLIDLQGREVRRGMITAGATDLRFSNVKRSVLFLQLNGNDISPTVLRVVTY
jgi:hypothetical protein